MLCEEIKSIHREARVDGKTSTGERKTQCATRGTGPDCSHWLSRKAALMMNNPSPRRRRD